MHNTSQTIKHRTMTGVIVSDKMDKTRVVAVERTARHQRYHAQYKVTTRYKAHDEENAFHTGDTVVIQETRPRSRDKRWEIVALVKNTTTQHAVDREEVSEETPTEIE